MHEPEPVGPIGVEAVGTLGVHPVGILGVVGTALNYAVPVELGVKAQEITRRVKKKDGTTKEVTVHHPGTEGAHMFENTLKVRTRACAP